MIVFHCFFPSMIMVGLALQLISNNENILYLESLELNDLLTLERICRILWTWWRIYFHMWIFLHVNYSVLILKLRNTFIQQNSSSMWCFAIFKSVLKRYYESTEDVVNVVVYFGCSYLYSRYLICSIKIYSRRVASSKEKRIST